jgi:hypothetical protein
VPWGALGKDSGFGGTFTRVRTWARARATCLCCGVRVTIGVSFFLAGQTISVPLLNRAGSSVGRASHF